jgi:hypothetical protein
MIEVVQTDTVPNIAGQVVFDVRGDRMSLWTGEGSI